LLATSAVGRQQCCLLPRSRHFQLGGIIRCCFILNPSEYHMSQPVTLQVRGDIAVITINNPPVNALSHGVRAGLIDAITEAESTGAKAAVVHCAGRTFCAGADIREFGKPPVDPWLPQVVDRIEASPLPVVAAIHGTALGGGLETALGCHFRIASTDAKLGFPEVNLGLLPGAGGTQRAPRLMGVQAALDLIVGGKPLTASQALATGLIDRIAEGELLAAALEWANELAADSTAPRRSSGLTVDASDVPADFFAQYRAAVQKKTRGLPAPQGIIDCVQKATSASFEEGSALEREWFQKLMKSPESKGLRHVFFAEREAARVEGLDPQTPLRPINRVGIIGAGTMGGGIAMSFANAGIRVTLLEMNPEALNRGLGVCQKNYDMSVKKGRFTADQAQNIMGLITGTTDYADLVAADLVIEAVFEDPEIKKTVFRQLDQSCKAGAILATNTSYQNVDEIAAVTSRPQDVIGMHFFSPANVMKLLEVVRGAKTADDVLATVMKLAVKIGKVPVVSRVCYGFIGNRMLEGYFRQALMMLLEGATPAQIDGAMERFGMAMGPIAVGDLAGWDVGYKARRALPEPPDFPGYGTVDILVESGRLGQKTGSGYYKYDPATRQRLEDPEVNEIIRAEARRQGVAQRQFSDAEIVERLIYPLINTGAKILQEGIAQRASDIDVVYLYGYGFPAHRGGPMFYADTVGAKAVYDKICEFRDTLGRPQDWQPAALLRQLAESNGRFGN
jgi:3-hydroxyacyl-CoA dehydrogenase